MLHHDARTQILGDAIPACRFALENCFEEKQIASNIDCSDIQFLEPIAYHEGELQECEMKAASFLRSSQKVKHPEVKEQRMKNIFIAFDC